MLRLVLMMFVERRYDYIFCWYDLVFGYRCAGVVMGGTWERRRGLMADGTQCQKTCWMKTQAAVALVRGTDLLCNAGFVTFL
jgi:hypothetical protein